MSDMLPKRPPASRTAPPSGAEPAPAHPHGASVTPLHAPTAKRIYPRAPDPAHIDAAAGQDGSSADGSSAIEEGAALDDVVHGMLAWRRAERDLERITSDPTRIPGFERLPEPIQALAKADPMVCVALWELAEQGVDFRVIVELQAQLDDALRRAGWDGTQPPTDEQFAQAERIMHEKAAGPKR